MRYVLERSEEERRIAAAAVRHQRKVGDDAAALPSEFCIQPLGIAACGIEYQQRPARAERGMFSGSKQCGADAAPARATMNQHLGDVCAVRLIFVLSENDLNRADDPGRIPRGQQYSLAAHHASTHALPECVRLGTRQGLHEADGSPAGNAVYQHVAQLLNIAIVDSLYGTNLNGI